MRWRWPFLWISNCWDDRPWEIGIFLGISHCETEKAKAWCQSEELVSWKDSTQFSQLSVYLEGETGAEMTGPGVSSPYLAQGWLLYRPLASYLNPTSCRSSRWTWKPLDLIIFPVGHIESYFSSPLHYHLSGGPKEDGGWAWLIIGLGSDNPGSTHASAGLGSDLTTLGTHTPQPASASIRCRHKHIHLFYACRKENYSSSQLGLASPFMMQCFF